MHFLSSKHLLSLKHLLEAFSISKASTKCIFYLLSFILSSKHLPIHYKHHPIFSISIILPALSFSNLIYTLSFLNTLSRTIFQIASWNLSKAPIYLEHQSLFLTPYQFLTPIRSSHLSSLHQSLSSLYLISSYTFLQVPYTSSWHHLEVPYIIFSSLHHFLHLSLSSLHLI